jgi:hypothetical protein
MKAAEKEVEQLEREAREASGFVLGPEHENGSLPPIELPPFRVLQKQRFEAQRSKAEKERKALEEKVAEIATQIRAAESRLKALNDDSIATIRETSTTTESIASRNNNDVTAAEKVLSASDPVVGTPNHYDTTGAMGPGGEFVEFPPYDGSEPPLEWKKAFTQYCNSTKKDLKASLPPEDRKNKVSNMFCSVNLRNPRFVQLTDTPLPSFCHHSKRFKSC